MPAVASLQCSQKWWLFTLSVTASLGDQKSPALDQVERCCDGILLTKNQVDTRFNDVKPPLSSQLTLAAANLITNVQNSPAGCWPAESKIDRWASPLNHLVVKPPKKYDCCSQSKNIARLKLGIRSQSCFCPPLVSHWQPRELLVKWRRSLPVSAQDTQTLTTWYMVEDIVKSGIKGSLKTILPFHKSELINWAKTGHGNIRMK